MDGNILSLVDLFISLAGAYLIYSAIIMKRKGEFNESLLWNKNTEKKRCKDKEGFIRFFFPHMLGVGVIIFADGIISYLGDRMSHLRYLQNITLVIAFIAVIWYAMALRKAMKEYFVY